MTPEAQQIEFELDDLIDQTKTFYNVLNKFSGATQTGPIKQFLVEMTQTKKMPTGSAATWEIREDYPVRIGGSLEGDPIEAEVACIWRVRRTSKRAIAVAGMATTRVVIKSGGEANSMWRMEVGASDEVLQAHPGPYFHVQILGRSSDRVGLNGGVFPYEVPRFPFHPSTPTAALEFVLAELFRDEWSRHTSTERDMWLHWASMEQALWSRYLDWLRGVVTSGGDSPLALLKAKSPGASLLPS